MLRFYQVFAVIVLVIFAIAQYRGWSIENTAPGTQRATGPRVGTGSGTGSTISRHK